ncbi:MAG TPA: carboxypeptidase-like regulatory domain-containing protein [Pyrinomonadaceae bacterium]|nr:carboxypeptidase-like regulatory domain-containing protein [Pyrinomonadaceae bacterium]
MIILLIVATCFLQTTGRLQGVVRTQDGAAVPNAVVVITNQVTRETRRIRTNADGSYSVKLPAGAYRITLDQPHMAAFDKDKNYGDYAIVRGDTLENVIVEPSKEINLEIRTVEVKGEDKLNERETPDRWRITFPEYDRYGDRGARGRDIPFKRGRWWDPYNQNVLKGDYPIKGDKLFMILTAVSATNVEQRRAPTPSGVSSVNPISGEFFGRPEQFAAAETLQFSFELFHGDTTFKPRDWAIKFSPTFSVPNYLDARENGVVNIDVRRGTNRTDWHASLEEAFGEVKLFDVNANYDFVSVRTGIQPFVSDFRGFIFSDNNLGARVFGSADNNRVQFNAAYFSMLEKDTNSGLNRFDTRHQNVYIANIFRRISFARDTRFRGVFTITTIGAVLSSIVTVFWCGPRRSAMCGRTP